MFTTLLKPARGLMGRLKYLEKFLLISVLFVLPLASQMFAAPSPFHVSARGMRTMLWL